MTLRISIGKRLPKCDSSTVMSRLAIIDRRVNNCTGKDSYYFGKTQHHTKGIVLIWKDGLYDGAYLWEELNNSKG